MVIDMNEQQLNTAAQLRAFLNGTQEVQFEPKGEDSQRYAFIAAVVKRLHYGRLSRPDKGVVMRYLERTTRYSHAQLKRLVRRARGYETKRRHWTKTRGHRVPIAQRRAPSPDNRPGFIRIDSVHQGDQDGVKGLYHINAVDCVTQFEIVATCERLSEAYLLPVIETLLASFPFRILGFDHR